MGFQRQFHVNSLWVEVLVAIATTVHRIEVSCQEYRDGAQLEQ